MQETGPVAYRPGKNPREFVDEAEMTSGGVDPQLRRPSADIGAAPVKQANTYHRGRAPLPGSQGGVR